MALVDWELSTLGHPFADLAYQCMQLRMAPGGVMPGLGGQTLSEIHARETADALNRINPEFIRLRTLAIPNSVPLFDEYQTGEFF